ERDVAHRMEGLPSRDPEVLVERDCLHRERPALGGDRGDVLVEWSVHGAHGRHDLAPSLFGSLSAGPDARGGGPSRAACREPIGWGWTGTVAPAKAPSSPAAVGSDEDVPLLPF